jgi:signal transduction histidine kinase
MSEQLADANRALAETQERLAQARTLATIGEVAAGAAHEMNNPLTVISGRAQLLASQIHDGQLRSMADQIVSQASCLTDMISALRALAEPPNPRRRNVDLAQILTETIAQVSARKGEKKTTVKLIVPPGLPQAHIDPDQISEAVKELVKNALEAEGSSKVEVRAHISDFDGRLMIQVTDDGSGLSAHARAHAFDPFFSEKPAGRQPGLGLSRARRLIEGHGGLLALEGHSTSTRIGGAQATIALPSWRRSDEQSTTSVCH